MFSIIRQVRLVPEDKQQISQEAFVQLEETCADAEHAHSHNLRRLLHVLVPTHYTPGGAWQQPLPGVLLPNTHPEGQNGN